jgi:predicted deacetylase
MHGVPVLVVPSDGPRLESDSDAVDLIAKALEHGAEVVLLPAEQLTDDFFNLRTRRAGEFVQKFVNYRLRLAILGDISRHLVESSALRDFVAETNRGGQLWFVATTQELDQRLGGR